jgi:hypothetical protein
MKDFFEAVDRAFIQGAARIPAPRRLELKTLAGLPLSAPESSPATSSSEWRPVPERRCHGSNLPVSRRGIAENGSRLALGEGIHSGPVAVRRSKQPALSKMSHPSPFEI